MGGFCLPLLHLAPAVILHKARSLQEQPGPDVEGDKQHQEVHNPEK